MISAPTIAALEERGLEYVLGTRERTDSLVRTVVLADSSKLGVETAVRFATLDGVDALVTDSDIDAADRRALEQAGIEVVIA